MEKWNWVSDDDKKYTINVDLMCPGERITHKMIKFNINYLFEEAWHLFISYDGMTRFGMEFKSFSDAEDCCVLFLKYFFYDDDHLVEVE
jgi:hypothetical protein